MNNLDEFIAFAENSHIVVADYEARRDRLEVMILLRETDKCPLLDKWIADAYRRLEVLRTLYEYALVAKRMPLDDLRAVWMQIKELKQ